MAFCKGDHSEANLIGNNNSNGELADNEILIHDPEYCPLHILVCILIVSNTCSTQHTQQILVLTLVAIYKDAYFGARNDLRGYPIRGRYSPAFIAAMARVKGPGVGSGLAAGRGGNPTSGAGTWPDREAAAGKKEGARKVKQPGPAAEQS